MSEIKEDYELWKKFNAYRKAGVFDKLIEEERYVEEVYVVTCPENGWDCVQKVFHRKNVAEVDYPNDDQFVIHRVRIC